MLIFSGSGEVISDFDPNDFGATMWVSGDDPLLSSLNADDPVSPWTDRITGTRTWTAAGTTRPLFKPNGVNGLPYLAFDASNDVMGFSHNVSTIVTASEWTIAGVMRPQTNGHILGTESGKNVFSSGGFLGLCLFDAGGVTNKFRVYRFNGGYTGVNSTTTYILNTWYIVIAWWDGTNLNIRVRPAGGALDTLASIAASNPQQLTDTPQMSWSNSMGADLAELFTKDTAPADEDEVIAIVDGLAGKYNF